MIAEEQAPLAVVGDGGRLGHDVGNRQAIFLAKSHIDARHQREVEGHLALIAIAEVGTDIGRPLIGLGQDETVGVVGIDGGADGLDDTMSLGQVLAGGAIALDQVGYGVYAQRVDAHVEPEAHGFENLFDHRGVVEVQVGLERKEAVPVVGFGRLVPAPVGFLRVGEDNAGVLAELVGRGPDIHRARR